MSHFVSLSCEGETCTLCGAPATHKVGEEILWDDPVKNRHNLTAYVCCTHFREIFGAAVPCPVPVQNTSPATPSAWIHTTTGRLQRYAPRTEQVASWQPLYDYDRRAGATPVAWVEQHTDGSERVSLVDGNTKVEAGWRRVTPLFGWGGPRQT